ncbi:iron-sulfur cluster biosynthesis family protein [Lentilactobacillus hilgardii]|uniref:iron-sulfur cluster biosynthesis family protein n=1 Tax=Lentilactobacillus hilgardii TaxID=1588 RepID=UPI00390CA386
MEIIIKEAAKEYLENQLDVEKDLLLAADDGSNEYSKIGGSCAIGDKFQIVATTHKNNNYKIPINNAQNWKLYTSNSEQTFLGIGLTLDLLHNNLVLKDDSGILDNNITFQDADKSANQTDEEKMAERKALSQHIC